MVATPSKLAALAALLLAAVDATSIENNPVTILEAVVPMTDAHPAYGGPVREIKPVVVPDNTDEERAAGKVITNTSAVEIRSAAYRKLEGAPTDMAKLEEYFGTKLEVNYKKLLSSCKKGTPHQIPWPSSYWPVYMDSINARWTNEASPAEKYAKAFGKDVTKFMDTVSQVNGIDGFSSYKKCTSNPDCASDGSTCAKRAGKSSGYCIPTWYGICHAWAPASNWEPEPQCDVVKNGVTFHPYDLKGLVSAIYDGAQINTVFTGTRFYGPDSPDTKDKYGRYTDAQRRDLGAGFFHIAIANIMCLQGHSFVVDVTAGAEVWNQPVSGYEVIESTIMDPAKAGKEHFGTNNYPFNDAAKYVAYTKTRFSYIIEAYEDGPLVPNKLGPYTTTVDYEYFVELDASYNVIGGEWLGDTRYNHPDFLWFATGTPSLDTVTKIGLSYKEVRAMIDESVACKGSSTPAPTTPAPTTVKPTTTPAPTTPAPTTPTPTTVKPTTTPAATTVKPTTTPAATTATPTSTPVATTVKPTSTPAVTTDKPSVTTPAPTDKPSVTTPAPTTDKPAATTPAPTTASPSTGATPVPTTVAPPAGKPTPAPEPSTDAPPAGKPTPPGGKPTPPAGKPTPAPEPSTASPSTGATPVPTTVAPPAGKPTPPGGKPTPAPEPSTASPSTGATPVPTTVAPPAGKPTPAPEPSTDAPPAGKPTPPAETPASGGVPPPGKVTPPGDDDSSEDDDVPVPPSSGSGKPTPVPETPAVTPAVTTAAPPAGKPTPAPSATTVAPPSDDGKGTVSPPGGDDDENDDTPVTPGSGSGKLTPPAPVPAPVPAPDSGSGKPTPPAPVPAPVPAPATSGSGSSKPTPPAPVPAPVPAPDTGAGKPTPPAPVPAPVPAPESGAGKPTPPSTGSDREASSGSDAPTPAPTKKNKKHKLCH